MAEEKKSLLYKMKPLIDRMPAVSKPDGHVPFKTKMYWTIAILVFYYVMTNVFIYGLDRSTGGTIDLFASFRAILAGAQGSLLHLGIGPIVTGSIIMQLFTGAKIIKLDLTDTEDKAIYQGAQKVIVVIMIVVEAVPQVFGYLNPSSKLIGNVGLGWARSIIIFQLCVGSYLVFLMDELVSKWGMGSGISLFIAAGVAEQIFTGTVNWEAQTPGKPLGFNTNEGQPNLPAGTIPRVYYAISHMSTSDMTRGGFQMVFINPPNPVIALMGTIFVFIIVSYAESCRIELPLAHGKVRGARGRYPIRLVYASNIPVILMSALLANINMFSLIMWNSSSLRGTFLGHNPAIGSYPAAGQPNPSRPIGGFAYYVSSVNGLHEWLLPFINNAYLPKGDTLLKVSVHVIVYLSFMIGGSVIFAKFWIETTNMGPEDVAKQIQSSGMQIPGFRRDPRVLKRVLERYIPVVTVLSGAFVGALAAFADMVGTVGNSSGTGTLLMVGIIIRLYEQIGKEQAMEMHPVLRGFFGAD